MPVITMMFFYTEHLGCILILAL